jgi:hypothetical protein
MHHEKTRSVTRGRSLPAAGTAGAVNEGRFLRYPDIHDNRIVFTCEGDLPGRRSGEDTPRSHFVINSLLTLLYFTCPKSSVTVKRA